VVRFRGLKCPSPVAIAQVQPKRICAAMSRNGWRRCRCLRAGRHQPVDGALCLDLEEEYGKPFIAINAATYWHALRAMGIEDRFEGWGRLLAEH
jgi:maleate isomerase